jgi:predicted amidohydrolase
LRSDGILAAHISSQRLNLMPVLAGLARDAGLEVWFYPSAGVTARATWPARWAVLRRRRGPEAAAPPLADPLHAPTLDGPLPLWTDDHTPLFDLLKPLGEG